MITRIAPTPSGYIHQGNIFNFLINWLWARSCNGKVMLRIDDSDSSRKRKEYTEDIFRVLDWLELDWDIGPSGPDDFEKNWSQHFRLPLYNSILTMLEERALLYTCTCTRKANAANYPFSCGCAQLSLPLSTQDAAIRIKTDKNSLIQFEDITSGNISIDLHHSVGAFVVRKKDGFPSYQVCSLADDQHFGITHICRGNDLVESTAMQLYINQYIGKPFFHQCSFWHHPLLQSGDHVKLSKSAGAQGFSIIQTKKKETILSDFCHWLNLSPEAAANTASLATAFSAIAAPGKTPGIQAK